MPNHHDWSRELHVLRAPFWTLQDGAAGLRAKLKGRTSLERNRWQLRRVIFTTRRAALWGSWSIRPHASEPANGAPLIRGCTPGQERAWRLRPYRRIAAESDGALHGGHKGATI
jgi:hypothetical protein